MSLRPILTRFTFFLLMLPLAAQGMQLSAFWNKTKAKTIGYLTPKNLALTGLATATTIAAGWYIYKSMYNSKPIQNMTTFEDMLQRPQPAAPVIPSMNISPKIGPLPSSPISDSSQIQLPTSMVAVQLDQKNAQGPVVGIKAISDNQDDHNHQLAESAPFNSVVPASRPSTNSDQQPMNLEQSIQGKNPLEGSVNLINSFCMLDHKKEFGKEYLAAILNDDLFEIPASSREQYLQAIVEIIHHLYNQKGNNFTEGTFLIEDIEFKLYNFLLAYVKNVNHNVKGTFEDYPLHVSYNPFGYCRDCSHYPESKKSHRPYGIDMRFTESDGELELLPAKKRHILFGIVDEKKQLMYIKIENYGLFWRDGLLMHAYEFFESKATKLGLTGHTDQEKGYRKERIPTEFVREVKEVLSGLDANSKKQYHINELLKSIDTEGIKALHRIYTAEFLRTNKDIMEKLAAIIEKYEAEYDHLHIRSGQEVIFNAQDLKRAAGL